MNGRSATGRGRASRFGKNFISLMLVAALGGCAGASDPPQTAPDAPSAAVSASLARLRQRAEQQFAAGELAYRNGNFAEADEHFQSALDVYIKADGVAAADRDALQEAFSELFNRIQALGLSDLVAADEIVSLNDEPLPPPSPEHLAALREHLVASPPALPRFSIPVPSPLENERVEWAIAYLTGDRKQVIEEGLARAARYRPMIEAIFDEVGVPRELAWVPLIESLYKTGAYSRAAAVGLWQFVSGTARMYGLKVDYNIDERRDPVKSTRVAAIYMKYLYEKYHDWALVLAAYNVGWGRINRALEQAGVDNFWDLAQTRYIPRETKDHVPKIYASILIGSDPEYYGLEVAPEPPYTYDESVMDANTQLSLVADLAGLTTDEIRELNPHIIAWVPKGYAVRIPAGSKRAFEAALAEVPPAELMQFMTHVVSRGETLSQIASQYPGARMSAIVEVNNLRNPNRLSIGQKLIIPMGPESRPYRSQAVTGFGNGERTTYTVQRGDSLFLIAQNFKTDAPHLMRWNNLTSDRIYPGDTLIVYYGVRGDMATPASLGVSAAAATRGDAADDDGGPSSSAGAERNLYTVRRGDSLYEIAQRFGVSIDDIKRWNSRSGNLIHPGDKLVVFAPAVLFADQPDGSTANATVLRYTVRRGDSAFEIAQRYKVDLDALLGANGLTRRSNIYPGDELLIPGGSVAASSAVYTVRLGDTLGSIAQRHGIPLQTLLLANDLDSRSVIYPGDSLKIPRR